jgi:hypothetical protein
METSLIAPLPEADSLVAPWWAQLDPWAARGVAAHVTVAMPFLPESRITEAVLQRLSELVAPYEGLPVLFDRVAHLPGAVSILPADDRVLRQLTSELSQDWHDVNANLRTGRSRPYHLTIACTEDAQVFQEITRALAPSLPIRLHLSAVHLIAHDAREVRTVAEI